MLTIRDLMNPNIKNKESKLQLEESLYLKDIDMSIFNSAHHEYVNVVDKEGHLVGAVKTERLVYLISKQKENSFIQILDTMDAGLVVIDRDSRIFYVNPAYGNILGINISKILGRYLSIIEPEAALLDVLKTKKTQNIKNRLIKSINTYVDISTHPLISGGDMVGAYSVFTDVTKENRLNKEIKKMTAVAEEYNQQIQARKFLEENKIIGESKIYLDCVNKALKVANTDTMVLLRGENGTGKEVIVNLIKSHCARKDRPFITINCSAIPDSLIESELFGYEEGAFTGARKGGKIGYFEMAKGGTLFLDEISELPFLLQGKLLEVLQEGTFYRVGGIKKISADVRLIVATNRDLEKMVKTGRFREDLYYRINVFPINLPPLRDRINDLESIVGDALPVICERLETDNLMLTNGALEKMKKYGWPGNIRELENVLEKAAVMAEGSFIREEDIILDNPIAQNHTPVSLKEKMDAYEKEIVKETFLKFDGNRRKAAEELGISKTNLFEKIHKYGIDEKMTGEDA